MTQSVPAGAMKLLAFISSFEAPRGYLTVYGNRQASMPKPLTAMTIDEVIADGARRTREYGSSAAGAYQVMRETLRTMKAQMGLTGRELFDQGMQDQIGYQLLKQRGYARFMAGSMSVAAFGNEIAKEWASFPVLTPTNGKRRGQSYYAGDGLNHVLVGADPVERMLMSMRAAPAIAVADPVAVEAPRVPTVPAPVAPALPWWARLLGLKPKPVAVVRPGLHPNGSPALWDVQSALRERNYYRSTSALDGLDGGATQSAVSQSRKDNGLDDGGVDAEFLALLPTMPKRPVSTDRAGLSVTKAAERAPELFNPAKWLGGLGMGAIGLGGANGSGLLDTVQSTAAKANDVFGSVQTVFGYVAGFIAFIVEHRTLVLIAGGAFLVIKALGYVLDAWVKVRAAFF